jgi:hypothetical protein
VVREASVKKSIGTGTPRTFNIRSIVNAKDAYVLKSRALTIDGSGVIDGSDIIESKLFSQLSGRPMAGWSIVHAISI